MSRQVEVIISHCTKDGLRTYGLQSRTQHWNLETAMSFAEEERRAETCVIVRPCYNEGDAATGGRYFREWRSINGAAFKEVRWYLSEFNEPVRKTVHS